MNNIPKPCENASSGEKRKKQGASRGKQTKKHFLKIAHIEKLKYFLGGEENFSIF